MHIFNDGDGDAALEAATTIKQKQRTTAWHTHALGEGGLQHYSGSDYGRQAGSQAGSAALRLMQIVFSSFLFHDDGPSSMQSVLSVLKGLLHCLLLSDEGTPSRPLPH